MAVVLLLDDNVNLARFTGRNLETAIDGLTVLLAHTCGEAIEIVKKYPLNVVIMDRRLPDGDGLSLLPAMRSLMPALCVIVVSADDSDRARSEAEQASVFEILPKPFEAVRLIETVRSALSQECESENSSDFDFDFDQETTSPGVGTHELIQLDEHFVLNRLARLMAGLRAYGSDLKVEGCDPGSVQQVVERYENQLIFIVDELARVLKEAAFQIRTGIR